MTVTVSSVQRAAPDILVATILDGEYAHGGLIDLATAYPSSEAWSQGATNGTLADMSTAAYGVWTTIDGLEGDLVGPDKMTFRTKDEALPDYLDRDAIVNVAGYGQIGPATVTAVYYENFPEDEGITRFGTSGEHTVVYRMEHRIYLKLDMVLADGSYTIPWPDLIGSGKLAVPADTDFTLADKTTVCPFIHINQNGYGIDDERKHASFHGFIPEYENGVDPDGVFDPRLYAEWPANFHLIDKNGAIQFTNAIEFRMAATTIGDHDALFADANFWVGSLSDKTAISAITNANPGVVTTAAPHGFVDNDKVYISGALGMTPANCFRRSSGVVTYDTVTRVSDTEFSFGVDTTSLGTYTSGGYAHAVHRLNTLGTHGFNLEFANFDGPVGDYRIWIPGWGVTPLFRIDNAVWARLADYGMRGVVAHYSGVELDDRFGYPRPRDHYPTSLGGNLTIYKSKLPLEGWSREGGGFIDFGLGAASPWITATPMEEAWGGIHDAGDWDRRTWHITLARFLLLVHELVPDANASSFNVPRMSSLIPGATFAGTDSLPDAVQVAMWIIDLWRRMQQPDGSVPGGIESASTPIGWEPSWKQRQTTFVYSSKDPLTAYIYAAAAAHLSRVLADEGFSTLAATYQTSAMAAWDYAESVYADLDTLWAEEIAIADGEGEFASTAWATYKATITIRLYRVNSDGGERVAAASSLYRLIDDAEYKDIVEDWWDGTANGGGGAQGGNGGGFSPTFQCWDYSKTTHAGVNATYQTQMLAAINNNTGGFIAHGKANSEAPYITTRHVSAQAYGGFGVGSVPTLVEAFGLIATHAEGLSNAQLAIEVLQAGTAWTLGNNPPNCCMMKGLGYRNWKNILHEDSKAMGVDPPDGVCIYGFHHWRAWVTSFLYGSFSWSHWPSPKGAVTNNDAPAKLIEPEPGFRPMTQWIGNGSQDIPSMEYTNQQTQGVLAGIGLYLQGKGGTPHFTFAQKRIRLRMAAA